jgi:1-acyl-sn-glycerol-3-phosphate acyltransferase
MKFKLVPINIIFVTYLFLLALLSPALFIFAIPIYLAMGKKYSDQYINGIARAYSRNMFFMFGIKIIVEGKEHLPVTNNLCFVSNHQGLADIPLIIGYIPKTIGFIAKKELGRIPILNIWMKGLGCILIDRSDVRQSLKVIEQGVKQIERGHPMVIFPEGTRSRTNQIGIFKPGAFKLVLGAKAYAIPITIDGTYKMFEENWIVKRTTIRLVIHPPINVEKLNREKQKELPQIIRDQIIKGLEKV